MATIKLRDYLLAISSKNSSALNDKITILDSDDGSKIKTVLKSDLVNITFIANQLRDEFLDTLGDNVISSSIQVNHDSTTNFVANEHIDHTSVSILAGDGLIGGGDISSDKTINVVSANDGIDTNDDSIELNTNSLTFTSGVKSKLNVESVISASSQIDGEFLNTNGDDVVSSSAQIIITDTIGFTTLSSSLQTTDTLLAERATALELFSSSLDNDFATDVELAAVSSAFDSTINNLNTNDVAEGSNLYYTDVRVKDKLNTEGVISGSSQVQIDSVTGFTSFSSSVDTNINDLFITTSNHEGRINGIEAYTSSLKTAISVTGQDTTILGNLEVQGTTTTVDSTTIELGDNIIELNGSGAVNGGLLVKDVTAPNTISGSLLWDSSNDYWKAGPIGSEEKILLENGDGVVSSSAQITLTDAVNNGFDTSFVYEDASALYYTDVRVKAKLNTDGVLSGSSQLYSEFDTKYLNTNGDDVVSSSAQIQIDSVIGFTSFSSSVASNDDDHDSRITSLETFSSSLDNNFATDAELTSVSSAFDSTITSLTTDDIAEGSNLYYTDVRVKDKLNTENVVSSSTQIDYDSIQNQPTDNTEFTNGAGYVNGTGSADYISKWVDGNTITASVIYDDGTNIGIGTDLPNYKLDVNGIVNIQDLLKLETKSSNPASPEEGMVMASGSVGSSKLYYYDGNIWDALF